jgi:protein O-GlcNAc transferase
MAIEQDGSPNRSAEVVDLRLTPGDPELRRQIEWLRGQARDQPGNCGLQLRLSQALAQDGAFAQAAEVLQGCIDLTTDPQLVAGIFFNLGTCREEAGDLEGALVAYEQCLFLRPELGWARYRYGRLRRRCGDAEAGLRELERAAELEPADVEIQLELAEAFQAAGRFSEARLAYRRVLRLHPGHLGATRALGALDTCVQ